MILCHNHGMRKASPCHPLLCSLSDLSLRVSMVQPLWVGKKESARKKKEKEWTKTKRSSVGSNSAPLGCSAYSCPPGAFWGNVRNRKHGTRYKAPLNTAEPKRHSSMHAGNPIPKWLYCHRANIPHKQTTMYSLFGVRK